MSYKIESNGADGNYVDPYTLDQQLKNYVTVREMHDYTCNKIDSNNDAFDNKLSNYVKHEELKQEMIDLLKEKRATFRFWFPIITSIIVSFVVAYYSSHK